MRAIVLGSAAGGGFPQWNCRCAVCSLWWTRDPRVKRRTQSSVAVSIDNNSWVLLNCSPDVREQIGATVPLHPRGLRDSPIQGVILTNADIDHIAGLLSLREKQALTIWASAQVIAELQANPIFAVLDSSVVKIQPVMTGTLFAPLPGLSATLFEVPGKAPLYQEAEAGYAIRRDGRTVGLHLDHEDRRLTYAPGCADIDNELLNELSETHALLFDGTLYRDDEMILSATGPKTARRMGHVPVSGKDGTLSRLTLNGHVKRFFVHINNTNPLLIDGSPERQAVEASGWTVSHDGLEICP